MLWTFRTELEGYHRRGLHFATIFLNYQPSARDIDALPKMTAWDFADTCNKSVPVYLRMQPEDGRWSLFITVLHNYIYHRWFRPYRSDVEDHRFICKFIMPKDLPADDESGVSPSRSVLDTLIAMNKAISTEADTRHREYAERLAAGDKNAFDELRLCGLPIIDLKYHRVQPLFRALLVVVDSKYYKTEDGSTTVGGMPAFLVRTGIEDGLSAPISFGSIADRIDGYEGERQDVVKTTLEAAIDFVMGLEERERAAFGIQPPMADDWSDAACVNTGDWEAQPWGDEPLIGPSSRFVDAEEYPQWSGYGMRLDLSLKKDEQNYRQCLEDFGARRDLEEAEGVQNGRAMITR
jgi:hypothetical protein